METLVLIEVLDSHQRSIDRQRYALKEGAVITIGRSVSCDVVLDDPFVAERHVALQLNSQGQIVVNDLGSINGVIVNGNRAHNANQLLLTKPLLQVGRTRIKIRTATETLPPEQSDQPLPIYRHGATVAAVSMFLALIYIAFKQWLQAPDDLTNEIAGEVLIALLSATFWIGFWAMLSRIGVGAWRWTTHAAIACVALATFVWTDWLLDLFSFVLNSAWLSTIGVVLLPLILIGTLYRHLRTAANMSAKRTLAIAALVPLTIIGVMTWRSDRSNQRDVNRVQLGDTLFVASWRMSSATPLNTYLHDVDTLQVNADRKRLASLKENPLDSADDASDTSSSPPSLGPLSSGSVKDSRNRPPR